ncbi:hypothetical protein ACFZBU_25015 [Embleya sp. NPDC008237]|uniref:hypothetical protein n=1 Tax=Embleya sp. NPDC008237 TaxID=3363978 RepID=UPI0036EB2F39
MKAVTDRRATDVSVARHLVRGAVGFGALVGAFALLPVIGPAALLLAPVGLIALRGCPTCWVIGLIGAISAGRLERQCEDGRCTLQPTRPSTDQIPSTRAIPGAPATPATGDDATTPRPNGKVRTAA